MSCIQKLVANFRAARLSLPRPQPITLLLLISFLATNNPAPQQPTHRFRTDQATHQHLANTSASAEGPFSSRWQTLLKVLILRGNTQFQLQHARLRGGMPLINGVPKTYWEMAEEVLSRPPLLIYHETAARRKEAESLERELILLRCAAARTPSTLTRDCTREAGVHAIV